MRTELIYGVAVVALVAASVTFAYSMRRELNDRQRGRQNLMNLPLSDSSVNQTTADYAL